MNYATILKETYHIARKDYDCAACEWLTCDDFMARPEDYGVSFADKRILVKIRKENYKVLKGTKYLYQVGIMEGDFYAVHCRADAVEICHKYDLIQV